MIKQTRKFLVPGILVAAALVQAVGVYAQTPPAPKPAPAKSTQAAPVTARQQKDAAAAAKHDADMQAECKAMMAKKQEMKDKLLVMDASLDKLVADMNAAKWSKDDDARERSMVAVINELVSQRKASRDMMMEMEPGMMAHMMGHMGMHGARGTLECPMMKAGSAPEPKAGVAKPKM